VGYGEEAAISKDGKQLAYTWFVTAKDGSQLRLANVPPSGMLQPRVLFDKEEVKWIAPRDWSRDGEWLAVLFQRRDRTNGLGLVSTRDGALRILRSGPGNFFGGSLSPDGKYLAYSTGDWTHRRSFILAIDAKSEVPLTSATVSSQEPLWTPDGARVVFASDLGGTRGLWSVRVVNGQPQGEPELMQRDFRDSSLIGFTRNGTLAYTATRANADVYLAGLNPVTGTLTSGPKRVNQRAVGNSGAGRLGWLDDGKAVSYWSQRNERTFLVVHTLATGEEQDLREVAKGVDGPGYAGWFPDGKTLMNWERKGETMILRHVNPWTGEELGSWSFPSTGSGDYHPMTFSRDLTTVFHTRKDHPDCRGDQCEHVVIGRRLDDGKDRVILRMRARMVGQPWPSPDGREIAFFVRDGRGLILMVATLDSGAAREIYRDTETLLNAILAWSADSSHLLAFSTERGREALWSFPAKGGPPVKSPIGMRIGNNLGCAVSPNGRQLLFVGGDRAMDIWTLAGAIPARDVATR
jgi:Tol biopolymer transport system component